MLTVLIETRNDEEGLARTLASLVGAAVEGVVRDVIVCDRGSTDQTHYVAEHAGCHYVASGGDLAVLRASGRNVGTEALHGYLMHRASEPNPVGLLGAMWIIEGLGDKMAREWAGRIEALTGLDACATRFLRYHGANDGSHMDKLYGLLDRVCTSAPIGDDIVRTATVVGRLYALQLEEIDVG